MQKYYTQTVDNEVVPSDLLEGHCHWGHKSRLEVAPWRQALPAHWQTTDLLRKNSMDEATQRLMRNSVSVIIFANIRILWLPMTITTLIKRVITVYQACPEHSGVVAVQMLRCCWAAVGSGGSGSSQWMKRKSLVKIAAGAELMDWEEERTDDFTTTWKDGVTHVPSKAEQNCNKFMNTVNNACLLWVTVGSDTLVVTRHENLLPEWSAKHVNSIGLAISIYYKITFKHFHNRSSNENEVGLGEPVQSSRTHLLYIPGGSVVEHCISST